MDDSASGFAQRLAAERLKLLETVEDLGVRVRAELADDKVQGRIKKAPDRNWMRAFRGYAAEFSKLDMHMLLAAKYQLEGRALEALTEDQYRKEMLELGREALGGMSMDDLLRALAEKGWQPPRILDVPQEEPVPVEVSGPKEGG